MKLGAVLNNGTTIVRFTHRGVTRLGTVREVPHRRLRRGQPKAVVTCDGGTCTVRLSCLEVIPQQGDDSRGCK